MLLFEGEDELVLDTLCDMSNLTCRLRCDDGFNTAALLLLSPQCTGIKPKVGNTAHGACISCCLLPGITVPPCFVATMQLSTCQWNVKKVGAQPPGRSGPRKPSCVLLCRQTCSLGSSLKMTELPDRRSCSPRNTAWMRAVLCSGTPVLYIMRMRNVCIFWTFTQFWAVPAASVILTNPFLLCFISRHSPHLAGCPAILVSFSPLDTLSSVCWWGLSLLQESLHLFFPLL